MQNITIGADGSISMPAPGKMKITVEMDEATFEEFMAYRRNNDMFENAIKEIRECDKQSTMKANRTVNDLTQLFNKYFKATTTKKRSEIEADILKICNEWKLLRGDK